MPVPEFVYNSFSEAAHSKEYQNWTLAGKPHMWVPVERNGFFECQIDTAHGYIRLMHNGEEVCRGKNLCTSNKHNVVCMDTEFYGISKYIWR